MRERGNILFLILLAMILFAALSYAVTSSMRGGGKNAGTESAQASLASIMQYASGMKFAVDRMLLSGVPENQLDFYSTSRIRYDNTPQPRDNTLCTTTACEVLSQDGGKIPYMSFEKLGQTNFTSVYGNTNEMPGHWSVRLISIVNVGTPLLDLAFIVGGLKPEVCDALHQQIGMPYPVYRDYTGETNYQFEGDPTTAMAASNGRTLGDDAGEEAYIGRTVFCVYVPTNNYADFYYVIKER